MKTTEVVESMPILGGGTDRSPGLHLTEIIKSLGTELGLLNLRPGITEQELNQFGEVGFIWEEVLSYVFAARMSDRPPEVFRDGVFGSPDGLFVRADGELVIDEYKATWLSASRAITDNWKYMTQVKGYCAMTGTRFCRFRVLYINGDYKPPTPIYKRYDIEFTQEEIDENWMMLLNHARYKGWL